MTVYLVGGGPGDPGLLSLRGRQLLGRAEVVVHDRLSSDGLLALAPPSAELLDVGKAPGSSRSQEAINQILVDWGRRAETVVRLKGGDPFIFGRGGEEAAALEAAGVDYEVVPGVTAAIAGPSFAGIPLTHRGLSASFAVVTGHRASDSTEDVDWSALSAAVDTIVILMGISRRRHIADSLMAAGLDAGTPVAVVRWASQMRQTVWRGRLDGLGVADVGAPATIVVGKVAALSFDWASRRPLSGRKVVVTRPAAQATGLAEALAEAGAEVICMPVIETVAPADAGAGLTEASQRLGEFDWVVFTSANGVNALLSKVRDARCFGSAKIAAIGPATSDALARHNLAADLVPQRYVAEGLLDVFPAPTTNSGRVLIARAAVARDVLPAGLAEMGWNVEVVEAYMTRFIQPPAPEVAEAAQADVVTFTSPSTAEGFLAALGGDPSNFGGVAACIGPVTAATAAEIGFRVALSVPEHTSAGLVRGMKEFFGPGAAHPGGVAEDR